MKFSIKKSITKALLLCGCLVTAGMANAQDAITIGTTDAVTIAVSGTDTMVTGGPVTMLGAGAKLYVQDGAALKHLGSSFTMQSGSTVYGANAAYTTLTAGSGTGKVLFAGTAQQTLNGTATLNNSNNTFPSMEINNLSGVKLVNTSGRVGTDIKFTNGHLFVDVNDMILGGTGTISGYDPAKFVVTASTGTLKRERVNGMAFTFPVGYVNAATAFLPATLANIGTADTFSVRAINPLTPAASATATGYLAVSWDIKEGTAGGSNVQLALQHNSPANEGSGYASATAQIVASPATSAWAAAVSTATIAAAGTVPNSMLHTVSGVNDFSTNTFFSKATANADVPDLTVSLAMNGLVFNTGAEKDCMMSIVENNEVDALSSTQQIQVRMSVPSNFDVTVPGITLTSTDQSGISGTTTTTSTRPNENGNWLFKKSGSVITITSKPGTNILAGAKASIGFHVVRKTTAIPSAQNITLTVVDGSGGETMFDNNGAVVTVTAN